MDGPGSKAGVDGLAPDPVGTAAWVDKGASEEVGGPDLAAPEVKGDRVGEVMVGVCEVGLGPEVTAGASSGP